MVKKQHLTVAMIMIVTIGVALVSALPVAAAKTPEDIDSVLAQETPMKEPAKNARSFDIFTMAFMGLSLGCMLMASAVHWNRTRRNAIENQIRHLAAFVDQNTSVTFHVGGGSSANPMVSIAKEIAQNRDAALQACDDRKAAAVNRLSDVEADIMRMFG